MPYKLTQGERDIKDEGPQLGNYDFGRAIEYGQATRSTSVLMTSRRTSCSVMTERLPTTR